METEGKENTESRAEEGKAEFLARASETHDVLRLPTWEAAAKICEVVVRQAFPFPLQVQAGVWSLSRSPCTE